MAIDNTVNLDKLVELTKGYSGADIAALVNAAAMSAIKEYVTINRADRTKSLPKEAEKQSGQVPLTVSFKHFEVALNKIKRNGTMSNRDTAGQKGFK